MGVKRKKKTLMEKKKKKNGGWQRWWGHREGLLVNKHKLSALEICLTALCLGR